MLTLSTKLRLDAKVPQEPNLASRFTDQDLAALGGWVWDGYDKDNQSRRAWSRRTQAAMDLALQVVKDKSFPWPNAANIAFPLVTIASLQFHSRAYPALVSGTDVVKCRVVGEDPEGSQAQRATRISCHMSYQVLEEDQGWEEQHDRLLIALPIVGCAFKKSYHSAVAGRNKSELVFPKDLVLDYYAKSVEDCARKTHIIPLYRNEVHEKMLSGVFTDYSEEAWYQEDAKPYVSDDDAATDKRTGSQPPQGDESTPFTTLEQHCWLDLDGDGYAEPYIITIEADCKKVLRIVARWNSESAVQKTSGGRILRIRAEEYFTKYGLIPSPDGSIYDIGFGVLLGPLNESVNSLVNQLLDAGTMATTAGGFLGKGAKIRGGSYTFAPLEWKRVDSTGDDLRKNIVPLEVREPSPVLFNLLNLLINYTERISGSTDMMVGENPGQNTPAETSRAMVEQGMKIYTAIFKRVWRSMKEEFKKLYILNGMYLPAVTSYGSAGERALREDYLGDPNRVVPAADPSVVSENARIQQAITIKQDAAQTPGYDMDAVTRNMLKAMKVEGAEALFPGANGQPPGESEKVTIAKLKLQGEQQALQFEQQKFVYDMMEQQRLNTAQILKWEADAAKASAEAGDVGATTQVTAMQAMISAAKNQNDALNQRVAHMLQSMELQLSAKELELKDKEIGVKKNEPAKTS